METVIMIFGILNVGFLVFNRLLIPENKLVVMNEIALVLIIISLYIQ